MSQNIDLKFYLFKFHNTFDGLLGLDNLKALQAKLDLANDYLLTPNARIKLQFHKTQSDCNCITVSPRVEQVIRIKTSVQHGDIIIPHQKFHNCEIPESLSTARKGFAYTTILNNTCEPVTLDFSHTFEVDKFDPKIFEEVDINCFDDVATGQELDFSKFRTDHLNEEEYCKLIKLINEYSDIFYNENQPLTFTKKIKHCIKTTDKIPVYSKSYRYPFIHKQEGEKKWQVKKMLDQQIIRPSHSPWSSPI